MMILSDIISHVKKLALDSDFRRRSKEKRRLFAIPRYVAAQSTILGKPIKLVDSASFLFIYGEIFEREIYRFKARSESPRIIDGGANIGLSVIYFKRLYPEARVTAFEPDASIFGILKENLSAFGYTDVECVRKALWHSETTLDFLHEGADGGRIIQAGDRGKIGSVTTERLRQYLSEPVDFLKLDIEGAETEVLKDCADLLNRVENLFVEYHSFADRPQSLSTVINIMAEAGFRLHIHAPLTSSQPFYTRDVNFGMDMQLNIFGFRSNMEGRRPGP